MLNKICKTFFIFAIVVSPLFAGAVLNGTEAFLTSAQGLLNYFVLPITFSLALLAFFWGVAKYIWSEGTGKEEGKKIMIWGVVALFIMSSIWGIIRFIQGEFDINNNGAMPIPKIGT